MISHNLTTLRFLKRACVSHLIFMENKLIELDLTKKNAQKTSSIQDKESLIKSSNQKASDVEEEYEKTSKMIDDLDILITRRENEQE